MESKTKKLLGCGVGLITVFLVLVGYGIFSAYSFFAEIMLLKKEIPTEIKESRILQGESFLSKTEFFKLDETSFIETIRKSLAVTDEKERQKMIQSQTAKGIYNFADIKTVGDEIIAVGEFGGFVFDFNGNLKRTILFEPTKDKIKIGWYEQDNYQTNLGNLEIVQLSKDEIGFSSTNSVQGSIVFDKNGNQLWNFGKRNIDLSTLWQDEKELNDKFEKDNFVLQTAVGDLDNDGVAEFIVSQNSDGIHAFDRNGNEKWFQHDEFANDKILVFDLDNDGKNELVELGSKVRNGIDGKLVREMKGDDDNAVLIGESKDKKKTFQFCSFSSNKFICKNEEDVTLFEAVAPLSNIKTKPVRIEMPESTPIYDPNNPNIRAEPVGEPSYVEDDNEGVYKPKAVWVTLKKEKPKYIAVIASFIGLPRANFYVYDEKGNLVYHELLPEDAETITVLPSKNGNDSVLVGGKSTIWNFTAN